MSINYDLLKLQIDDVRYCLQAELERSTPEPSAVDALSGVIHLLEYLIEEQELANINPWEDEADHAANYVKPWAGRTADQPEPIMISQVARS